MEKVITVAQVIVPILVAVLLGVLAKRRKLMTPEQVQGLQQFVLKFGLPCVIFTSCLTANMGMESLSSMGLVLLFVLLSTVLSFTVLKKRYAYHNLPMLFCAQETGMLTACTKRLRPLLKFLFPGLPKESRANELIATNFIANIFGLGWAATPAGLEALADETEQWNVFSSAVNKVILGSKLSAV